MQPELKLKVRLSSAQLQNGYMKVECHSIRLFLLLRLSFVCLFIHLLVLPFCVQVEQYGNLIFHGLEGSCQEYIANVVARCIKVRH